MTTFPTLDAWLAHLESAHPVGIDMGLARIGRVKDALGLSFDCPVITVGGTNGKGSTCAILETILLRAGYSRARRRSYTVRPRRNMMSNTMRRMRTTVPMPIYMNISYPLMAHTKHVQR